MVDIEISVINIIYDTILFVFEKSYNCSLMILLKYGNINYNDIIFLNLMFHLKLFYL